MSDPERVTLTLKAAPDDHPVANSAFQQDLKALNVALRNAGIIYLQRTVAFNLLHAIPYAFGEYFIPLAIIATPSVRDVLATWITERTGRKLKLKVRDVELRAGSPFEIDVLITTAMELEAQSKPGKAL